MLTKPKIVDREAQPYVAITTKLAMSEMRDRVPKLLADLSGWLATHGVAPAGALFFKFNVIDMPRLEIEIGYPIAGPVSGEGGVHAGTLPAGRYASLVLRGSYENLRDAHAALLDWAEAGGIKWDMAGDRFACRLEIYRIGPAEKPDPANWETDVAIRLADA